MNLTYKTQAVAELAAQIKQAGFRVFIAKSGTYGFFTDAQGSRVVSFQYDLGGFKFSGNYKTEQPRTTGTGWQLDENDTFAGMFNQHAPQWAVRGYNWKFSTLAQHLATYQSSSQYTELMVDGDRFYTLASSELALFTINTGSIYTNFSRPTALFMAKHKAAGTYDEPKAKLAWFTIAELGAKQYATEFASDNEHMTFTVIDKLFAANEMADYYAEDIAELVADISKAGN